MPLVPHAVQASLREQQAMTSLQTHQQKQQQQQQTLMLLPSSPAGHWKQQRQPQAASHWSRASHAQTPLQVRALLQLSGLAHVFFAIDSA
jgi:hypothetical protein